MNLNRGKTSSYQCSLTCLKGYRNNNGNENSEQNDKVHCHSRVTKDWKIRIWVNEKYIEKYSSHEHCCLKAISNGSKSDWNRGNEKRRRE